MLPGCGSVTVAVEITAGACQELAEVCVPQTDCTVKITRTYSGIPPGSIVTGCVIQNGLRYCIDPPFSSTGGSGSPPPNQYTLECGSGQFT